MEAWNEKNFSSTGVEAHFVQDNVSVSSRHTLRGLHYQIANQQGKLVRVLHGEIFDAVVDLRRFSSTFGRPFTINLSAASGQALWIPEGFAHGFLALADDTVVQYKVTDYWAPQHERTLLWNDPALQIQWPLPAGVQPLLSAKDAAGNPLAACDTYL